MALVIVAAALPEAPHRRFIAAVGIAEGRTRVTAIFLLALLGSWLSRIV
jgi:hypothetical protein